MKKKRKQFRWRRLCPFASERSEKYTNERKGWGAQLLLCLALTGFLRGHTDTEQKQSGDWQAKTGWGLSGQRGSDDDARCCSGWMSENLHPSIHQAIKPMCAFCLSLPCTVGSRAMAGYQADLWPRPLTSKKMHLPLMRFELQSHGWPCADDTHTGRSVRVSDTHFTLIPSWDAMAANQKQGKGVRFKS